MLTVFLCQFTVGSLENDTKSCKILYGGRDLVTHRCLSSTTVENITNANVLSDAVTVFLPRLGHTDSESEFCFTAMGTTEAFTVAVKGTFKTGMFYIV